MGKSLLDDGDDAADIGDFTVNKEFAKRFEHNKEREELHRLEALHPEKAAKFKAQALREQRRATDRNDTYGPGEDSSSSEEEAPSDDEDEEGGKKAPKEDPVKKKMYLKDLLKHGPEEVDEDAEEVDRSSKKPAKAYDAEQEGLRKAFLKAFDQEVVGSDIDDEEDEEHVQTTELFEHAYNF
eukprot:gene1659-33052_t